MHGDVRAVEGDDVVGLLGLELVLYRARRRHDDYKENKWCEYHSKQKQFNTPSSSFNKESKEEDGCFCCEGNDGKELDAFFL